MKNGSIAPHADVIRIVDSPDRIDATQWDALLAQQPAPTLFLRHAYLSALHNSGSAVPQRGWVPHFLTVERLGSLVGACPLYLKAHSYGEYVFDWAWADAYRRHGLRYYPKLLGAVPFTPVPGTRLLARDSQVRTLMAHTVVKLAKADGLSSAHVLFTDEGDAQAFEKAGWLVRHGVQFHWSQRQPTPWFDFAEFLGSLHRDKRKKILQERRRVAEAGIRFETLSGPDIGHKEWDFFHHCYMLNYEVHGSTPYLTRDFFQQVARTMPLNWLLFIAYRGGERVAASLIALDPQRRHAYGRYWGATCYIPCLHFEACYYQPLEWCIRNNYAVFEGGAQGEHKMARGLLPVRTRSAHWLADARFASAVADFLEREGAGLDEYVNELKEHDPFRPLSGTPRP